MAGYPATLPAISLTAVQDKKGEGGGVTASCPQDEGGFQYTNTAHCGYIIFMCDFKYHQIWVMGVADSLYHVLYDDSCNK